MIQRLPPREKQIAAIVQAHGQASATEVRRALPDAISDAAVRSMLSRLVAKGVLLRRKEGRKFVYRAKSPDSEAREAAVRRFSRDFFDGSLARMAAVVTALLVTEGMHS